ncbi:ribonuclease HI [Rhizobium sp. BK376]|uniref:RNase H family protein n=1 Tax=Rhizobium sp. BK376 TaxID=2512149 RepID=UPI00104728B2|nr:ribonuclease HI [Rhizobium sp. BK376]
MSDALQAFVDRSFDAGARSGGWAVVVLDGDRRLHVASGTGEGLSNNSFEVLAAIQALVWLDAAAKGRPVILRTDSFHVVEGCHRWRAIWRGNGWSRINPNPRARRRKIPDAILWRQLDALLTRNPVVAIEWCKGHSGVLGNESADAMAAEALAHAKLLASAVERVADICLKTQFEKQMDRIHLPVDERLWPHPAYVARYQHRFSSV